MRCSTTAFGLALVTDNATVGIQSVNVAKHIHPKTDEIQYITQGDVVFVN